MRYFEKYEKDSTLTPIEKQNKLEKIKKKIELDNLNSINRKRGKYFEILFMDKNRNGID